jgi:uncharacterized protein YjbI with pentapeptide repeats
LARIVLSGATISGVSFSYSNLSRANLRGVDLGDADMTGSYLFLTMLAGANMENVKGLTQEQLAIACGTTETKLPAELSPPETWPCPDYDDD